MSTIGEIRIIARIRSEFPQKFGIPRQSGLVNSLKSTIIFEPEYRIWEALRGLENFSHIWLLWYFSANVHSGWSPTVRPPRLGGNARMGVFATRSPFRPNSIALSCVRLEKIEQHRDLGGILHVSGADLLDNTPILDIKPYLPYTDCRPEATGGFAPTPPQSLPVKITENQLALIPCEQRSAILGILGQDPRPHYQSNPNRIYVFDFAGFTIRFRVQEGVVYVTDIISEKQS